MKNTAPVCRFIYCVHSATSEGIFFDVLIYQIRIDVKMSRTCMYLRWTSSDGSEVFHSSHSFSHNCRSSSESSPKTSESVGRYFEMSLVSPGPERRRWISATRSEKMLPHTDLGVHDFVEVGWPLLLRLGVVCATPSPWIIFYAEFWNQMLTDCKM